MLTESCVIFFCRPQPFKGVILRGHLSTGRKRERRENKAGSKTAGGRDLVEFQLELTPNHRNSHLENTGIRSIRFFFVPVPNQSFILPIFSEKSDPEVSKSSFLNMICARFSTKGICRMRVHSNLPISASRPLAVGGLGLLFSLLSLFLPVDK